MKPMTWILLGVLFNLNMAVVASYDTPQFQVTIFLVAAIVTSMLAHNYK